MLLLTDRLEDSLRLQNALETVEPCTTAVLDQTLDRPAPHSLLVCDIALDSEAATQSARVALSHYRGDAGTPLLCLTRDPSQLAFSQARALGATAILSRDTHPAELAARVRLLVTSRKAKGDAGLAAAHSRTREAGLALSALFGAAQSGGSIPTAVLDRGGDAVIEAVGRDGIRVWLDMVWRYDDLTYQHCLLVAGLTSAFAQQLGLSLPSQRLLSQAALVHDIGKAVIPRAILTKAGTLSPAEMAVMRTHAARGYDLLGRQAGFSSDLLDIVRHHHEYLDGSGYPDGLRGAEISQLVRIVTICDIYAALVERRSYKAPAAPEAALATLAAMGRKLDGGLLAAFRGLVHNP